MMQQIPRMEPNEPLKQSSKISGSIIGLLFRPIGSATFPPGTIARW